MDGGLERLLWEKRNTFSLPGTQPIKMSYNPWPWKVSVPLPNSSGGQLRLGEGKEPV